MVDTARTGRLADAAIAAVYVATALVIIAKYRDELALLFRGFRTWYSVEEWPSGNIIDDIARGFDNAD